MCNNFDKNTSGRSIFNEDSEAKNVKVISGEASGLNRCVY